MVAFDIVKACSRLSYRNETNVEAGRAWIGPVAKLIEGDCLEEEEVSKMLKANEKFIDETSKNSKATSCSEHQNGCQGQRVDLLEE